jgi:photosystem II stability/assembly factor-like uncharacterized protein
MGKKFIAFILLVTTGGCEESTLLYPLASQWSLVGTAGTGYYHGMWFVDRDNGWVVGDSGQVLNTTDGGASWNPEESGVKTYLKCVTFANLSKGWIGGRDNLIGVTTNGGASWTWHHPVGESLRTFMAISFFGENAGWIVDNYGGILHTEDGGRNWTPQTSGLTTGIRSVQFLDAREGWATADWRLVLHTTNGGGTWTVTNLDTLNFGRHVVAVFEEICFVNRSTGWIATTTALSDTDYHPSSIVATSDGGRTWKIQATPEDDFVNAFAFANTSVGWAAGSDGILYTNDGGRNWIYQLALPNALLVDVCLVDQSRCWALSFTGSIYRCEIP